MEGRESNPIPNSGHSRWALKFRETKLNAVKFKWILGHFLVLVFKCWPFVHFLGTCQVVAEYPISGRETFELPFGSAAPSRFHWAQLCVGDDALPQTFLAIKHTAG